MIRRLLTLPLLTLPLVALGAGPALACGGLVAPGHAEVLRRATTLAAYVDGEEHYVTGFQFLGRASSFGYIIPLPGVPSKIEKGGDWTLERLVLEVTPAPEALAVAAEAPAASGVEVLQEVRVDALDIVVVRGGGPDVYAWAEEHGFDMTPDTPEVLGAYSDQGAIFALAKFDGLAAEAEGLVEGQGTTIHFTIELPTGPWVPLRILSLGKHEAEVVNADLFVLTDERPEFAPDLGSLPGMTVLRSEPAGTALLQDLRSDKGMRWLPAHGMWLTAMRLEAPASTLAYDMSIDSGGPRGQDGTAVPQVPTGLPWLAGGVLAAAVLLVAVVFAPPRGVLRSASANRGEPSVRR